MESLSGIAEWSERSQFGQRASQLNAVHTLSRQGNPFRAKHFALSVRATGFSASGFAFARASGEQNERQRNRAVHVQPMVQVFKVLHLTHNTRSRIIEETTATIGTALKIVNDGSSIDCHLPHPSEVKIHSVTM